MTDRIGLLHLRVLRFGHRRCKNRLSIDKATPQLSRSNLDFVHRQNSITQEKKKMSKYIDLANVATNYAMRMNRLSNRIFGEVVRDTNQKSMKVVKLFSEKPIQKRSEIVEYYPRLRESHVLMKNLRWYGLFRDEHQDFKEEYQRLRALRGKRVWVKGEKKKENVTTLN